jgi:flagellar motility protein MotE (MotC chaperone)
VKHFWTYFVCGAGLLLLIFAMKRPLAIAEGDPRVKTISDSSMSLLKKDAPGTPDLEAALQKREAELEKKSEELKAWETRLGVEEADLKVQLEDLRNLQEKHAALLEADKQRRERITAELIKTYETMTAKKAAQVFTLMEAGLAADFLMVMKPKKVAAILDVMQGERAAELSAKIAGRRKPASPASKATQAQGE